RRDLHLAHRVPGPPVLHHARHPGAGPRLARRLRQPRQPAGAAHRDHLRLPAPPFRRPHPHPAVLAPGLHVPLHPPVPQPAATYAGAFAHEQLLQAFDDVFSGRGDDPEAREDLETLAAALKPVSTWLALDTVQECREACGGAGFIAENQLTGLHQDLDVYATFEGDNTVLLQLVAKRLLSDYTSELKNVDRAGIGRFIAQRAGTLAKRHTPWTRLAQDLSDRGNPRRAFDSMRQSDFQEEMLAS